MALVTNNPEKDVGFGWINTGCICVKGVGKNLHSNMCYTTYVSYHSTTLTADKISDKTLCSVLSIDHQEKYV